MMKTIRITMAVMFLTGIFAALPAQAQSRIEEQMKELENKNAMTDKIVKRDPKTKKVGMLTKNYRFYSQGGVLATTLREAFEEEERNASDVEKRSRGDSYESVLTFVSGRTKTVYRLSVSGDKARPQVEMQVYFRDETVNIDESSAETTGNGGTEAILAMCTGYRPAAGSTLHGTA